MTNTDAKRIEIGSGDPVILEKMYGPIIFADLRITADADRGWVIERGAGNGDWVEWVVIPAQLSSDFDSCPLHDGQMLRCEQCGKTRIEAEDELNAKEKEQRF